MFRRNLAAFLLHYARQYPIVAVVGPRQSGKTTLVRALFDKYVYLSLENLDLRLLAQEDPRGFLEDHGSYLILDEVQRAPELFSYLQEKVDLDPRPGQFILTGSQQFLLMEGISQSLAGRIVTFHLYPLTLGELTGGEPDRHLSDIFDLPAPETQPPDRNLLEIMFQGLYPRIYDRRLDARKWLENYVMTYVERDIRNMILVSNLLIFSNFLKYCAAQAGQLLNYASVANAVGISQPTAKKWISLLQTSGVIFLLPPFFKNFTKRIIKSPKLYFADTGLLCFLLSIRKPEELKSHPLFGHVFENFVVGELYKRAHHVGELPPLYFWRDKTGVEIDLVVDLGNRLLPIEIKSARTYTPTFKQGLKKWFSLEGNTQRQGVVIYRGDRFLGVQSDIPVVPWYGYCR